MKDAVLKAVDRLAEIKPKSRIAGDAAEMLDEENKYYDKVFLQRLNLWKINDTLKNYMLNEVIGNMVTKLEGTEDFVYGTIKH